MKSQKSIVAEKFLDKCILSFYEAVHKNEQKKLGLILRHHLMDALNELDADPYAPSRTEAVK